MIDILIEPRADVYASLIDLAVARCDRFSLVWRKQLKFGPAAHQIADTLQPFLVMEVVTNEWPGTKLSGSQATVRHYRLREPTGSVLKSVGGLYSWLAPSFPEDLAFYTGNGAAWLATVSHEHLAWFLDEALTVEEISFHVPGLVVAKTI